MSKKLYLYSICLAIVYIVFVGHSLFESGQMFVSGFKEGFNQSDIRSISVACGGYLAPVNGRATFPSKLLNVKTGEEVSSEITQFMAVLSKIPDSIPVYVPVLNNIYIFLGLILFALFAYLPFVVYRIMKSISKNNFYTLENINNIRKASIIVLSIFFINMLVNIFMVIVTNNYLQIEGYRVVLGEYNYSVLIMGLVVLILSEILRYTTIMKEEQEFTI